MAAARKKRVQIIDLAPRSSVVQISIGEVEVSKLGAGELVRLFLNYPSLRAVGSGKIDVQALASDCPGAIPEIISLGTGNGDEGINGANALDACDQLLILTEIIEISFPNGVRSFLERLATVMKALSLKQAQENP